MRAASWESYATELNLLEAYKADGNLRTRLLETVRWLKGDRPMLPMPHDVLRAVAEALGANEPVARAPASALEWALDLQAASAKDVSKFASTVQRVLKHEEEHFRATHEAAWAALRGPRKTLLSPEQRRMSARQFLDEVWMDPPHAYSYIEVAWSHLGLAGPVPVERLYNHPCWRLYLEAWGIGAYRQAFPANRDKPVGLVDVMQLIYLGCAPRRMFIVYEGALRAAANDVLLRRHSHSVAASPQQVWA
jgi:hypothetical protein